jgi:hypothetical protein
MLPVSGLTNVMQKWRAATDHIDVCRDVITELASGSFPTASRQTSGGNDALPAGPVSSSTSSKTRTSLASQLETGAHYGPPNPPIHDGMYTGAAVNANSVYGVSANSDSVQEQLLSYPFGYRRPDSADTQPLTGFAIPPSLITTHVAKDAAGNIANPIYMPLLATDQTTVNDAFKSSLLELE